MYGTAILSHEKTPQKQASWIRQQKAGIWKHQLRSVCTTGGRKPPPKKGNRVQAITSLFLLNWNNEDVELQDKALIKPQFMFQIQNFSAVCQWNTLNVFFSCTASL